MPPGLTSFSKKSDCSERRINNSSSLGTLYYTGYKYCPDTQCCGSFYERTCCSGPSYGLIVGAALTALVVIVAIIVCIICKKNPDWFKWCDKFDKPRKIRFRRKTERKGKTQKSTSMDGRWDFYIPQASGKSSDKDTDQWKFYVR